MLLTVIGWVIFANTDFSKMAAYLKNLVYSPAGFCDGYSGYLILSNLFFWIIAWLFSTTYPRRLGAGFSRLSEKHKIFGVAEVVSIAALLTASLMLMAGDAYNPFLYFRF